MRTLAAKGIRTGALIAPILPGLSDRREQLREVIEAVSRPAARSSACCRCTCAPAPASTSSAGWPSTTPALHTRYLAAYRGRSYLDPSYGRWLSATVQSLRERPTDSGTVP